MSMASFAGPAACAPAAASTGRLHKDITIVRRVGSEFVIIERPESYMQALIRSAHAGARTLTIV